MALPHNIGKQKEELTKLLQKKESLKKSLALIASIKIKRKYLKRLKWKRIAYILFTIIALCCIIFEVSALILAIISGGSGLIIFCIVVGIVAIIWLGDVLYNLYLITKKIKIHNEKMKKYRVLLSSLIDESIGHIEARIQHTKKFIPNSKNFHKYNRPLSFSMFINRWNIFTPKVEFLEFDLHYLENMIQAA